MNFKEHLVGGMASGAVTGTAAVYFLNEPQVAAIIAVTTLAGALSPDIDTGSVPSRIFAWIGIAVSAFLMYIGKPFPAAVIGIVYMAFSSDKHRGITHKWILPILCFAWTIYAKQPLAGAFGVGLMTHLALDKIPPYKII